MVRHYARQLLPWALGVIGYLLLATVLVRWDMQRNGEPVGDFGLGLYGMYTQLFFEPTLELPRAPLARLVFWVTPLLGAVVLLRGLVRVGTSVFDAEERRRLWVKVMSESMRDHIVVCGLGHVGRRVVEALTQLGEPIVAIERREREGFGAIAEALGAVVLYGDARQDALLLKAGVARARAVVCATDDDMTNLEVAIDAKRENPNIRVIMRIFDQRVAEKMRSALQVEETFSTSALAGPLVALQATTPGVRSVYKVGQGELRVGMEIPAPVAWVGQTVAACEEAIDGRVISLLRAGESLRPRHDTSVLAGDGIVLDVPAAKVAEIARRAPGR